MKKEVGLLALRLFFLLMVLFVFFLSLEMMGMSFKLFGKDVAFQLISTTTNPFVGLFIGILATSIIQSSSTTTSIVVGLVAAGGLTIPNAIPIIMGANIGTSVTNILVSFGSVTRKEEFRRALAGATVHDFFNVLTVLILFPLEMTTGYLQHTATYLADAFDSVGGIKFLGPVKALVKPVAHWLVEMLGNSGVLVLIAALVLLFLALKFMVDLLKKIILSRTEAFLHKYIFRPGLTSMAFGAVLTVLVQSSSITTSLIIPLVGSGILTVEQIFPYTLGANVGTTITAVLAALVTANPSALIVAFAHTLFNVTGIVIIYPLKVIRQVPIFLARKLSDLTVHSRAYAVAFVLCVFFILPTGMIFISGHHSAVVGETVKVGVDESIYEPLSALFNEFKRSDTSIILKIETVPRENADRTSRETGKYDVMFVEGIFPLNRQGGRDEQGLVPLARGPFNRIVKKPADNDGSDLATEIDHPVGVISASLHDQLVAAMKAKANGLLPDTVLIRLPDERSVHETVRMNPDIYGIVRPWDILKGAMTQADNRLPQDGIYVRMVSKQPQVRKLIEYLKQPQQRIIWKKFGLSSTTEK